MAATPLYTPETEYDSQVYKLSSIPRSQISGATDSGSHCDLNVDAVGKPFLSVLTLTSVLGSFGEGSMPILQSHRRPVFFPSYSFRNRSSQKAC